MYICAVPLSRHSNRDLDYPLWDVPTIRNKNMNKEKTIGLNQSTRLTDLKQERSSTRTAAELGALTRAH